MFVSSGTRAWWSDDPIDSVAGDELGRQPFAQRLAEVLNDIGMERSSTVVGLVGPWGSGKSSTINLTRQLLVAAGWSVVDLNPWALPEPAQVIGEVLGAIEKSIPSRSAQGAVLARRLAGYRAYLLPALRLIPVAGSALAAVGDLAADAVLAEESQPENIRKLNELLDEVKPRLLICIDDVDRLQPKELLVLFRAVRVLGRLHHVHYLLSYDEETVLDLLSRTPVAWQRPDRALAFLEKIVTVRLDQPPTREDQAAAIFDSELNLLIQVVGLNITDEQQSRLSVERSALLDYKLTEPRAVRRFFTQLHAYLPLLGSEEIDLIDFMTLSFLRTTYPKLYDRIRVHRRSLVDDERDAAARRSEWDEQALRQLAVEGSACNRVTAAMARLFPLLSEQGLSSGEAKRRLAGRRVGDPDHVDRYFALTPTPGDLSDAALAAGLADLAGGLDSAARAELVAALRPVDADERAWEQAARLYRRASAQAERLPADRAQRLLLAALSVVPASMPPGLPLTPLSAAENWLSSLLRIGGAPDESELTQVLEASTQSPLSTLISAMEAASARGDDTSAALMALIDGTAELAWRRFLDNVALGVDAPHERTSLLLRWARQHLPIERLRDEVQVGLGSRFSVSDLAARLIVTGRGSDGLDTVVGIESNLATELLGDMAPTVIDLLESDGATETSPHDDAASWLNLRAEGSAWLLRLLKDGGQDSGTQISRVENHSLLSFHPGAVQRGHAGLYARANVQVPFAHDRPVATNADDHAFEVREALLLEEMAAAPISLWAGAVGVIPAVDWQPARSIGRGNSACVMGIPADSTRPSGSAAFSADLITELDVSTDREQRLVLSLAVNLPDKLSLADTFSLLMALLRQVDVARRLWRRSYYFRTEPNDAAVTVSLESGSPLSHVIDVSGFWRVGDIEVSGTQLIDSVNVVQSRPQDRVALEPLKEIAAAALGRWLQDSSYRNFAEAIETIKREYRPVPH